ncbi:MAG: acyl-CoA thioesterase domain-containing protein, partial [Myxococcota bacterium]
MTDSLPIDWRTDGDRHLWEVPAGWGQGKATFGGLTVAAAAKLASTFTDRPLRTVQTQFLGFIEPGLVEARVEVVREGRNTTVIEVRLFQGDSVRLLVQLAFLVMRPASIGVPSVEAPNWTEEKATPLPFLPGLTPDFTKQLSLSFLNGAMPFSGGTEATAFNLRAVNALRKMGFEIHTKEQKTFDNPIYEVNWLNEEQPYEAFSKKYDSPPNPFTNFGAIMVCTSADEGCPVVSGADFRLVLPFDDPKT